VRPGPPRPDLPNERARLADWHATFAATEARGQSARYESLALAIPADFR